MGKHHATTPKKDRRGRSRSGSDRQKRRSSPSPHAEFVRSIVQGERDAFLKSVGDHLAPLAEGLRVLQQQQAELVRKLDDVSGRVEALEAGPGSRPRSLEIPRKAQRVSFSRPASAPPDKRLPDFVFDNIVVCNNMGKEDEENIKFVEQIVQEGGWDKTLVRVSALGRYSGKVQAIFQDPLDGCGFFGQMEGQEATAEAER